MGSEGNITLLWALFLWLQWCRRACLALSGAVSPHVLIVISLHKSVVLTAQLWPPSSISLMEKPHWSVQVCVCVRVCVLGVSACGEYGSSRVFLNSQHFTSQFVPFSDDQKALGIFTWHSWHLAFFFFFLLLFSFLSACCKASVAALTWRHTSWLLV